MASRASRSRSRDEDDDDDPMEDVESNIEQRPRRSNARKDYTPRDDEDDDEEGVDDKDTSKEDDDDDDESMKEEDVMEDDDEEEDEELELDDGEDDSDQPRRSARRRTQVVRSLLLAPDEPKRKLRAALRTSSRSTKFTSSMAEPSSQDIFLASTSSSPHKPPARRHRQRRRSLSAEKRKKNEESTESSSDDDGVGDSEEESEEGGSEIEEGGETEPLKVQRIIASRTETLQKWKEIGAKMNTTEVTYGSRWFQQSEEEEKEADGDQKMKEDPNAFQERFLVKWADLSFLHASWETQTDLVAEADAKAYLTTFFRKSVGGLLYSQDERCDGDYFDPAFTQVDRILEVQLPEGWDEDSDKRQEGDAYDYGMIMDRADPRFDAGTGRQFLIKWGNLPYTESTYEFERDLILNEVEYEGALNDFLKRNKKPTKTERRAYFKAGDEEIKRLYPFFGEKALSKGKQLTPEEREAAVEQYKKELQDHTYKNGGQLRDYQAIGVAWMVANYVNARSCILADEMGLGKTLQTAAMANILANKLNRGGPVLVVAPLSTLAHWYREFTNWTDLNTIIYHGSAEDRKLIRENEFVYECDRPTGPLGFKQLYLKKVLKSKPTKQESPWMIDVVITTPEVMVCPDSVELSFVEWGMLVVDEAHRLKNHNSKLAMMLRNDKFTFRHRMLLTGTPIQNEVKEFWSILHVIDPKNFGDSDAFLERYGDMKSKERVDELHDLIRPYILRRLKEDVEHSVPPKEETLIEVELSVAQKQYYRALYEKNVKFLHKNKKKALDGPSLNNLAMQLRKCCNHLFLLNGVEEEFRAKESAISEGDFLTKASGKLVLLDKLLPRLKEQGHRILLFSQFKIMLDILEDYLNARAMKFERIDGSITGNRRQQAIDRFQSPSTDEKEAPFIMMLSTRAGGVGINLTAADTCIIFDSDWNPQNDLQAQARCHRIGQTKNVKVYRLLTKKTYEMQMFHMASLKMGLDQAVLNGFENGASGEATLSKEEVENLLRHGAYDIFSEEKAGDGEAASNAYSEQDIDSILERHSRTVVHENTGSNSKAAGGTFSKATFSASTPGTNGKTEEIDIEDPEFWKKMVGEGTADSEDEKLLSGRRQRVQTNYSERAYNQQLNVQLGLGNDDGDDSESDGDTDAEEPNDDGTHERFRWGGEAPNEWKKDDVESLMKSLSTFGYGQISWDEFTKRLELTKVYGIPEIKRMCWTLLLFTLMDSAADDGEKARNRELRAAQKDREKVAEATKPADGGILAASLPSEDSEKPRSTIEELKRIAFEKIKADSSSWMKGVISDAVDFAKENSPREKEVLDRILRKSSDTSAPPKPSDTATMFATSVWPSLKNRGWKAEVIAEGSSAGKTRYSYDGKDYLSADAVLEAAQPLYPELQNAIGTIISSADENRRELEVTKEKERTEDLALSLDNATFESLQSFLEKYGSIQMVFDRTKSSVAKIRLPKKLITVGSLMYNVMTIVRRSGESADPGECSIDRLAKTLVVDKKVGLPHPLWTSYHDSVLIHAIAKHGWIDSDVSVRAIADDDSIKWGPPFDAGVQGSAIAKPAFDNTGQIVASAKRAAGFLSANAAIIESLKHFNQGRIVRSYSLKKKDGNESELLGGPAWTVDQAALELTGLDESDSKKSELLELPPKKDLAKRIRTVLSKPLSAICSEKPSAMEKPSHGYTVLDQRDGANVFLAELLRCILKEPGQSKVPKQLLTAAFEEARKRAESLSAEISASDSNSALAKEVDELYSISEHIDDAKRHVAKSAVQYKNVIRVILGEEPQTPRKESEKTQLFPPRRARPKGLKTKARSKLAKKASSKISSKTTTGERAIINARKRLDDYFGPGGNPSSSGNVLELTEIETFILTAACTHGIPVWTDDFDSVFANGTTSEGWRLTWESFGESVLHLVQKAFEKANASLLKAREEHQRVFESVENDSSDQKKRGALQAKFEAAQRTYADKEDVLQQATSYCDEPPVLAKKATMLLAKIHEHMTPSSKSLLAVKSDNGLGPKVMSWLGTELTRWAASLDLLDNYSRPLAFTAIEFVNDLPEDERSTIEIASIFDKKGCRWVAAQVAMMSRLRSMYVSYEGDSILSEKIERASKRIRSSGEKWDEEPDSWCPNNDAVLVNRLVYNGFTDTVMESSLSISDYLRLTKGGLQQRANQLARELHIAEELINPSSSRVLEERLNAALPAAAKAPVAVKSQPQEAGSNSFFGNGSSSNATNHTNGGAKPEKAESGHIVIDLVESSSEVDDDDVGEILGKVPSSEKRKSNDALSSSDKKPRTS